MAGLGILQLCRQFIFQVQFLMAILIETTNALNQLQRRLELQHEKVEDSCWKF